MGWMQPQRERIRESQPVQNPGEAPRVRPLGAFPAWVSVAAPCPDLPKESGLILQRCLLISEKSLHRRLLASSRPHPCFLDLVIQHTLIGCGCSQPKTALQMCLLFHHATGPLSSPVERTSWPQECAMRDHSELSLGSAP